LIRSRGKFIERCHTIVPDSLIKRIQAAIPEKVFCKGEAAMLGDGFWHGGHPPVSELG
jgi:hypothetical protein